VGEINIPVQDTVSQWLFEALTIRTISLAIVLTVSWTRLANLLQAQTV
jgi:hypothetical protein